LNHARIARGRDRAEYAEPITPPGGHDRIAESEIERCSRRPASSPRRRTRREPSGVIVALTGRNRLRGFVEEIQTDGLLA